MCSSPESVLLIVVCVFVFVCVCVCVCACDSHQPRSERCIKTRRSWATVTLYAAIFGCLGGYVNLYVCVSSFCLCRERECRGVGECTICCRVYTHMSWCFLWAYLVSVSLPVCHPANCTYMYVCIFVCVYVYDCIAVCLPPSQLSRGGGEGGGGGLHSNSASRSRMRTLYVPICD